MNKELSAAKSGLLRRAASLVKTITKLRSNAPLKPVWGGLPPSTKSGFASRAVVKGTAEELAIQKLREPLSSFLKDAERFVNDYGSPDQRQGFENNGLVRVAYHGGYPERGRYSKQNCLADLGSLKILVWSIPFGLDSSLRKSQQTRRSLAEKLHAARDAAEQTQEQAANEIGVDVKAFGEYERGERSPRANRKKLIGYIDRHLR